MQHLNSFKTLLLPHLRHLREGWPIVHNSLSNKWRSLLTLPAPQEKEKEANAVSSSSSLNDQTIEELPPAFGEIQTKYNTSYYYYDEQLNEEEESAPTPEFVLMNQVW